MFFWILQKFCECYFLASFRPVNPSLLTPNVVTVFPRQCFSSSSQSTSILAVVFIVLSIFSIMSNFGASEAVTMQPGYYMAKVPATNKGHGFTHEERAKYGLRGLYPGGQPFTLEQKVEV